MNQLPVMLTHEGTRKLKKELKRLIEEKESTVKDEDHLFLDGRIRQLEHVLMNAEILPDEKEEGELVEMGSTITLFELEFMDELTYTIVHPFESDPHLYKIASNSPIAAAALGKTLDSQFDLSLPGGVISYKIIKIQNCKR